MNTVLIVLGVILAIIVISVLFMLPELRRYMHIRRM
jgi:hypothetical protein